MVDEAKFKYCFNLVLVGHADLDLEPGGERHAHRSCRTRQPRQRGEDASSSFSHAIGVHKRDAQDVFELGNVLGVHGSCARACKAQRGGNAILQQQQFNTLTFISMKIRPQGTGRRNASLEYCETRQSALP